MAHVQLTTDVKNFEYSKMATEATGYNHFRYPTLTRPSSTTGVLVIGGNQNYLKIQAFNEGTPAGSAAATSVIYGWNFCSSKMIWVPQMLWSGGISFPSSAVALPFASSSRAGFFGTTAPVVNSADSNSKRLQFVSDAPGATLIVDCVGAQFIEFIAYASTATAVGDLHILSSSF
jgi:hypothetical protein